MIIVSHDITPNAPPIKAGKNQKLFDRLQGIGKQYGKSDKTLGDVTNESRSEMAGIRYALIWEEYKYQYENSFLRPAAIKKALCKQFGCSRTTIDNALKAAK